MENKDLKWGGDGITDDNGNCIWTSTEGVQHREIAHRSYTNVRISAGYCTGVPTHSGVDTLFLRIERYGATRDQGTSLDIFYLRADEIAAIEAVCASTLWRAIADSFPGDGERFEVAWPVNPTAPVPPDMFQPDRAWTGSED